MRNSQYFWTISDPSKYVPLHYCCDFVSMILAITKKTTTIRIQIKTHSRNPFCPYILQNTALQMNPSNAKHFFTDSKDQRRGEFHPVHRDRCTNFKLKFSTVKMRKIATKTGSYLIYSLRNTFYEVKHHSPMVVQIRYKKYMK